MNGKATVEVEFDDPVQFSQEGDRVAPELNSGLNGHLDNLVSGESWAQINARAVSTYYLQPTGHFLCPFSWLMR